MTISSTSGEGHRLLQTEIAARPAVPSTASSDKGRETVRAIIEIGNDLLVVKGVLARGRFRPQGKVCRRGPEDPAALAGGFGNSPRRRAAAGMRRIGFRARPRRGS